MVRRGDTTLSWQRAACLTIVIAFCGCNQASPDRQPAQAQTPKPLEPLNEAAADPIAEAVEAAEPAMVASAEVTGSDATLSVEEHPAKSEPKPVSEPPAPRALKSPKIALTVPDAPEYVYKPEVLMTKRDADTCLIKTGDAFPDGQLSDLNGQGHSLKELFGEKLTVVVFWANENRLGREQIQRLQAETVLPFENTGVNVIAISIGDQPEQIGELWPPDLKIGFTVLLDTDAVLFSKLATGRHPRTYLLDAKGNILWFDIEYSRGAARDLANAIHFYLGDRDVGDS